MALKVVDDTYTKGTHILFRRMGVSDSGKTLRFDVIADEDSLWLGRVEWFGRWRKYVFVAGSLTLYEETCLNEIAEFIKGKTAEHRQAAKAAKGAKA